MNIIYALGNKLYANITNQCPCSCSFCIRNERSGVGDADSLWLEKEPETDEIIEQISKRNLTGYDEFVFCGFGEPCMRLDILKAVSRFVRERSDIPIRLNTNGLSDLINGRKTACELEGLVDTVSVSLNAPDAKGYQEICRTAFGEASFDSVLNFARDCKKFVSRVIFTAVDVIGAEDIKKCAELAGRYDIDFRVRAAE